MIIAIVALNNIFMILSIGNTLRWKFTFMVVDSLVKIKHCDYVVNHSLRILIDKESYHL